MDDLSDVEQPGCPHDQTVMRDTATGWVCPACGHATPDDGVTPSVPDFDGPSIHGG